MPPLSSSVWIAWIGVGEPGDAVAGRCAGAAAADGREVAAGEHLAVSFEREAPDDVVRARIERDVDRSVGIDPADLAAWRGACAAAQAGEVAADQDLPVRLKRDRIDVDARAGIEGRVERAVRVEPADAVARRRPGAAAEPDEDAADEDLAVRLHDDGMHVAVRSGIEERVDRAVGVQAPDITARCRPGAAAEAAEVAADQDLPIGLQGQRVDRHSDAAGDAGVERRVDRAVGVETRDPVARERLRPRCRWRAT